ncbi:MAG: CerR family C-terminal domain-containing protein [Gemmatimonadales bacterium]
MRGRRGRGDGAVGWLARRQGHRDGDGDTRQRIFDEARELFADFGFDHVTVRDICQEAGANLAAVSYHFGDKLGLYLEVVRAAAEHMKTGNQGVMVTEGTGAAERLSHYIRTYVPRLVLVDQDRHGWINHLMRQEMAEPTPGAQIIMDEAILPRIRYLSAIVAELLGSSMEDPRVMRCVSSIQSQCLFYLPDPFRDRALSWPDRTPETAAAAAEHVLAFSLAGIEAVRAQ